MALRLTILALIVGTASGQAPPPAPPSPAAPHTTAPAADVPRPRLELARALQQVDVLLDHARSLREAADAAARLARSAEDKAKQVEVEKVVRGAAELQMRVDALLAASAAVEQQLAALQSLREALAAEAPASLLDAVDPEASEPVSPIRQQIAAAWKLPSLTEAETALGQLERVTADVQVVGLVRYHGAEVLRKQSAAAATKRNVRTAEDLLERASRKYGEVLAGPDWAESGEGSSLHAVALLRIVQVEASLYDAYRDLSQRQPTAKTHSDVARKHRTAAEEAFQKLRRLYPDATLPDGQRVVDVARAK